MVDLDAHRDRAVAALARGTSHLACLVEPDSTCVWVSPSFATVLGREPADMVGRPAVTLVHPDDLAFVASYLDDQRRSDQPDTLGVEGVDGGNDIRLAHADGHWVTVELLVNNLTGDPEVRGILLIGREVTNRRRLDDALVAMAGDATLPDAILGLLAALEGRVADSAAALRLRGVDGEDEWLTLGVPDELLARPGPWDRLGTDPLVLAVGPGAGGDHGPDPVLAPTLAADAREAGFVACWTMTVPCLGVRHRTGARTALTSDTRPLADLVVWSRRHHEPTSRHWYSLELFDRYLHVALLRREGDLRLRRAALHDELTGALSRRGLEEARSAEVAGAVLMIDLDGFKGVNDRFGHGVGDRLLAETARRIEAAVRHGDLVCRLGGDEFLVQLATVDPREAAEVARRVEAALAEPLVFDGHRVEITASVGTAPPDPLANFDELIARADRAMYERKRARAGRTGVPG